MQNSKGQVLGPMLFTAIQKRNPGKIMASKLVIAGKKDLGNSMVSPTDMCAEGVLTASQEAVDGRSRRQIHSSAL